MRFKYRGSSTWATNLFWLSATTVIVGSFAGYTCTNHNKWYSKPPNLLCNFYSTYTIYKRGRMDRSWRVGHPWSRRIGVLRGFLYMGRADLREAQCHHEWVGRKQNELTSKCLSHTRVERLSKVIKIPKRRQAGFETSITGIYYWKFPTTTLSAKNKRTIHFK